MPGKYSHSVVLADYSSRGLISLPPDQHSKYLNSSPLSRKPSVTQLRLHGTRSAQAVYRDPPGRSPGWQPKPDQNGSNLAVQSTPTKERLNIAPDENGANTFQPMRYSRYYEQMPKSSPAIGLGGQASQPELRTAYQRQQQIDANLRSLPPVPRTVPRDRYDPGPSEHRSTRPAARDSHSEANLSQGAGSASRSPVTTQPRHVNINGNPNNSVHSTARASHRQQMHEDGLRAHPPGKAEVAASTAVPEKRGKSAFNSTAGQPHPVNDTWGSSEHYYKQTAPHERHAPERTDSYASKHTQIWTPKPRTESEPNFDGFSDVPEVPSSYFDLHKPPVIHSRSSSLNSTLPIQRPDSSDRPKSRSQQSSATPVASSKAAPVRHGDPNSPSRTTGSSVQTSTAGHRTDSSISSVSMSNGYSHIGTNKLSPESPRKTDPPWRLPEIQEDNGFSPSIFEDKEGNDREPARMDEIDLGLTMGQISSGKDVTFDNSDAASELSAALPPPITRFRGEEDEFNANMAKLFGEGGDHAISKKASHTIGRSATKKTKGFFSKFRSRSQAPDR